MSRSLAIRLATAGWLIAAGTAASRASTAEPVRRGFVLPAGGRVTALRCEGSGQITDLAFHVTPALVGTLRHVVVKCTYDKARAPALRLPLTDLVHGPFCWPVGRWHRYHGDTTAGIRFPWTVREPRFHHPEVTFLLNLPMPFADGLRIELVNRSAGTRFAGFTRAVLESLPRDKAHGAGRLCGTRKHVAALSGRDGSFSLRLPGPGRLVGLGLYLATGSSRSHLLGKAQVTLRIDQAKSIAGRALLPNWNRRRDSPNFMYDRRHFAADPIAFDREARLTYEPGAGGAEVSRDVTAVALWYRHGARPYEAPALAARAEPLPCTTYRSLRPVRLGPDKQPTQKAWEIEAEDLAAMAVGRRAEASAVQDVDHNYHPSDGGYLRIVADEVGGYVDCAVPLPHAPYVAVGCSALWGPNRGVFEIDLLSRRQAGSVPAAGRGHAEAQIRSGHSVSLRRDPSMVFASPLLNPSPGREAVLRFICREKRAGSNAYLLKLDRLRLDMPPRTRSGWC